ncbi:MAG: Isoquinoline 1-oxidoreductase subunit [Steroidobacter sp.]
MRAHSMFVTCGALLFVSSPLGLYADEAPERLRPVSEFSSIKNKKQRSVALFQEAGKVIQHPRCVNCHPAGDRPLQYEGKLHEPPVVRGPDGHGAPAMECSNCHHDANYDPSRTPGHPKWHVAPLSMAWEGKSLASICEQIKDRSRNGDLDLKKLEHHMAEDSLVGWGWNPGAGREPAPGTQAEFGELIKAWIDTGAVCPKEGEQQRVSALE